MSPFTYALAIVALLLGFGLTSIGSIGGAVVLVTAEDRMLQKGAVAVTCFSLAGFIAIVSQIPALVLQ